MKKIWISTLFLFALLVSINANCLLINNKEEKMTSGPIPFLLKDILVSDSGHIISNIEEWDTQKEKIKSLILSYLGEFPKKKVPLAVKYFEKENKNSYTITKISYASQEDDRVIAYLLIPEINLHPGIAVLALHPTAASGKDSVVGIDKKVKYPYALELVNRGYIVLAPDEFCAGERLKKGNEPYYTDSFYVKHPDWSAIGKAIWDNMISIDLLVSISYLGIKKVVSIGHSQGGVDTIFLAAFDERVIAAISNCGLSPIAGDPNATRWTRDTWFIAIPSLRPFFQAGTTPFDFHQLIALIAPRAFLNTSATKDEIWPFIKGVRAIEKQIRKVYMLYRAKRQFDFYYFNNVHSFPKQVRNYSYKWLEKRLKTISKEEEHY